MMISLEDLLNSLHEAILLFDRRATIVFGNKRAEELFGRGLKDIIGKRLTEILKGDRTISPLIRKTISEGRTFTGKSVNLDIGQTINMDFTISPFFESGTPEGAILSLSENITIGNREADQLDSVTYLLGSIAHEIKNPLGGIKGAAQLLRSAGKASIGEYIDLIIRETDRLNAILNDYLTICRRPVFHPVNVHEVIERSLAILEVPLKKAGIAVARSYDPSLPQIRGDESKLLQVFLNIIKNAIESMRKGGKVEVTTSLSRESFREPGRIGRWFLVSIRDTGRGIPEKELQKIFLPFYTKKRSGTGIGLTISRKIVRDHGGFIRVRSQKKKGTIFQIYIPFAYHG